MKRFITPIAAAVGIALASGAAHAQLSTPGFTTTTPNNQTTLILAIWDPNNSTSEVLNLSYLDESIMPSTNALTPNSQTTPFVTTASPDASRPGTVLQLNFGTVPQFTSTFVTPGLVSASDYGVFAGDQSNQVNTLFTSATAPTLTTSGVNTTSGNLYSELANIEASGTGENVDTTGSPTWSVQTGPLQSGGLGTGTQNFGGAIGSSMDFYYENNTTVKGHPSIITTFANSTGDGFWNLSATGDLTWNVPTAVSAVPLPAAAWLLASGLAGLGAVARRRRAGAALAA